MLWNLALKSPENVEPPKAMMPVTRFLNSAISRKLLHPTVAGKKAPEEEPGVGNEQG